MSGIGKTVLSTKLRSSANWFHYSADYRIGTRYLSEHILDNVKFKIMQMQDPFVAELLRSDSIYLSHNISVDNLQPVSTFLGMYGDYNYGGLNKRTFLDRQDLYKQAEISSMLDISHFIKKSWDIYHCKNFVNDASGSLCEIVNPDDPDDVVLNTLIEKTLIIYIQADEMAETNMAKRAYAEPKPLFYSSDFIMPLLKDLPPNGEGVSPKQFARNCFPTLIQYRKPKYEKISDYFGFKAPVNSIFKTKNEKKSIPTSATFLRNIYDILKIAEKKSQKSKSRLERYFLNCEQREFERKKS